MVEKKLKKKKRKKMQLDAEYNGNSKKMQVDATKNLNKILETYLYEEPN